MKLLAGTCMAVLLGFVAVALATPPNIPVSGHLPNLQNEEQVWICPLDTSVVITNHRDFRLGYRQIGLGRSTNGGASWVDTLIQLNYQVFDRQSDPIMTVTAAGRIVEGHLDYSGTSPTYDSSHVAFLTSDDCGLTWNGPYTVCDTIGPYFEDKQFVTADRSSGPFAGSVYVSWTRFSDFDPTRIILARSPDGGVNWNDTVIAGPTVPTSCFGTVSAGQFSQPLVGRDGALYVFWQGYDIDSSSICTAYDALVFNKSLDGGQTWAGTRLIGRVSGWAATGSGIDTYSQPTTEADLTSGPHAGNLYLQYRDSAQSPDYDGGNILCRRSLDTGHTWSAPFRVNDDPVTSDAEQFHNWLVINDDGILASIWYDERTDDPDHYLFDVFAGYSFDGGATWTANERISDVSIDPGQLLAATAKQRASMRFKQLGSRMVPNTPMAGLIAEYIGLAINGDKLVAVWTDTRQGDQDVWSARWYLHLTEPRPLVPNDTALACDAVLSWATAWKETEDQYRLQISNDISFTTVDFDTVTSVNGQAMPGGLAIGVNYWRVKAYRAPGGVPVQETGWSAIRQFTLGSCTPCVCACHADPTCDGIFSNSQDVVAAINVAFRGNPLVNDADCPPHGVTVQGRTDVDCSGATNSVDVVRVINVAFRGLSPATEYCDPCAP